MIKLVHTISDLQLELEPYRAKGSIGFVPTMGALHQGHLSLVEKATEENEAVVVSIFVNPTQFNDPKDLERYPRTLESDMLLLASTDCKLVFAPEVSEVYPTKDNRIFDFGDLGEVMEGEHRPGHFNGVAQVVSRLFEMVKPDKAYFGLKDFQQLAIIKNMVLQLDIPVEIVACPIVRENSGLAMSSRNELLSQTQRENASLISQTLFKAQKLKAEKSVKELRKWVIQNINKNPYLNVEYFEIVDELTLQPVESWENKNGISGCVAVFCGDIRLIDNIVF